MLNLQVCFRRVQTPLGDIPKEVPPIPRELPSSLIRSPREQPSSATWGTPRRRKWEITRDAFVPQSRNAPFTGSFECFQTRVLYQMALNL